MSHHDFFDISGIGERNDYLDSDHFPILTGMSPVHLRILNTACRVMNFAKNVVVLHEGDAPHDLYFLEKGRLAISRHIDGRPKVLAYLSPGDVYGEFGALRRKSRYASVHTLEQSRIIRVQLSAVQQVLDVDREFSRRLTELLNIRLLDSFFFNHQVFRMMPSEQRLMLAMQMNTRFYRRGTHLFQQGDRPTGIQLILSGEIEITYSNPTGEGVILEVRRDGDMVGELAVNNGRSLAYTATAASDVDMLIMDHEAMLTLKEHHEDSYAAMQEYITRRGLLSAAKIKECIKQTF